MKTGAKIALGAGVVLAGLVLVSGGSAEQSYPGGGIGSGEGFIGSPDPSAPTFNLGFGESTASQDPFGEAAPISAETSLPSPTSSKKSSKTYIQGIGYATPIASLASGGVQYADEKGTPILASFPEPNFSSIDGTQKYVAPPTVVRSSGGSSSSSSSSSSKKDEKTSTPAPKRKYKIDFPGFR